MPDRKQEVKFMVFTVKKSQVVWDLVFLYVFKMTAAIFRCDHPAICLCSD